MSNKGEGLLALEQLTQELLKMEGDEHALLCFDANDYRLLRQEELRVSALTVAEQVRQGANPFRFNPMTSRERRIIHLALREATDLRSESSGTGPYRHVVIYPAGMPSLPEPPPPPPSARRPGDRDRGGDRRDDRGGRGPRSGGGGDRGGDRGRRGDGRPPRRGRH
jgi:spoIIIJ-associated protein